MSPESSILYIVIVLFSAVQSIFGVGLLLFGTPTLLLIGHSYVDTLWILLPPSITISAIQIFHGRAYVEHNWRIYFLTVPTLSLCLIIVATRGDYFDLSKAVGAALLLIGLIRFSPGLQEWLKQAINKNVNSYYIAMGGVHGLSNMGGGPLSILMSTIYSGKDTIRSNIALVYAIFGISQLAVLTYIDPLGWRLFETRFCISAFLSYFFLGRFLAARIDDYQYQNFVTLVILIYSFLSFL